MSAEIKIDPAEALRRIITNAAAKYRGAAKSRKRRHCFFWAEISEMSSYGSTYSAHLATMYGFNADTGEVL